VIQPSPQCPPTKLGEWLVAAGAELDVVSPATEPLALDGHDAVVCLGGAMGVHDGAEHPWLAGVLTLLADVVRQGLPVLGVCLGGQLLTAATGGAVRRAPGGPESGTPVMRLTAEAAGDPLLGPLTERGTVPGIQSHHDEVHALPPGAVLLASSAQCRNQVFRIGERAWGLQCHIETTPEMVLEWASRDPVKIAAAAPGELDPAHLRAYHVEIERVWRPVTGRFVQLAVHA
jgi:GMP synthase-like glutamine amidotransferase